MLRTWVVCSLAALVTAACSTTYKKIAIDPNTGLYSTMFSVPAGGIAVGESQARVEDFGAVVLVAASNQYPSRLEFLTRSALADLGLVNVVNVPELRRWAEDRKFLFDPEKINIAAVQEFSASVTPLLIVDIRYGAGGGRHQAVLRIIDGRDGKFLLTVNHPTMLLMSVDEEVIYPVLNELRKWCRTHSKGA